MTTKHGKTNRPGNVRYRKDRNKWEARVRLPNGARPSAYFDSEREAWKWIARKLAEAERGLLLVRESQKTGDVLTEWLDTVASRNLRPNSLYNYRLSINFVRPWIGGIKLKDLKRADIEGTFSALQRGEGLRRPLKPATLSQVYRVLKMALEYCVDADYLAKNPMRGVKAPKVEPTKVRVLTDDEVEAILDALHGKRWEPAFWILATTGMRVSEMLGLEWKNVDLKTGTIRVEHQTGRVIGEPEKGVHLSPLKTRRSQRTVKIPSHVIRLLLWHRDQQRLEKKQAEEAGIWEEHGLVFCTPKGKPYYRSRAYEVLRQVLTDLGITGASPHTFRHTVATVVQESEPVKTAQDVLGHASSHATQRYSHPTLHASQAVAAIMEKRYRPLAVPSDELLTDSEKGWNTGGGQVVSETG